MNKAFLPHPKRLASSLGCFLLCLCSASGDTTINVWGLDRDSFGSNVGSQGAITTTTAGNRQTVTYNVTNLDLAEDGSANDTLTFSIEVAADGGTVSGYSNADGDPWGVSSAAGDAIRLGEGLNFSLLSSDITFGTQGSEAGLAFVGFTGVNSWFSNGDVGRIAGATSTVSGDDFGTSIVSGGSNVGTDFQEPVDQFFIRSEGPAANGFHLGKLRLTFKASPLSTLSGVLDQMEAHLNGSSTLNAGQIQTLSTNLRNNIDMLGASEDILEQAIAVVELYEDVRGSIFSGGQFNRDQFNNVNNALRQTSLDLQQGLILHGWTPQNVQRFRSSLEDKPFLSANFFPGAVAPPANPSAVYQVQINADVPRQFGFPHLFKWDATRRPTGAYLAPGSIAVVTVPPELVDKGYQIRVNAHVHELERLSWYRRMDYISKVYPITSETVEIASPVGGGIYIDVPYGSEHGLQTIQFQNIVRAPFYSNTVARQTSLQDWLDTERHHPAPWADFESDVYMMTLPRDWVYAWGVNSGDDNPAFSMDQWDDTMDVINHLYGYKEKRSKTTLYLIVDVAIRANVFSPGYPQSNSSFNPASASQNGRSSNEILNGPKFLGSEQLHELGHAEYFTKFNGEVEAAVNIPYVMAHYFALNVSIDQSLGRSVGDASRNGWSRDQSAIHWMVTEDFREGVWNMTSQQMQYQQRGYADYADLAYMYGLNSLHRFWYGDHVDYENGISYLRNSDESYSRIQRMSKAAGIDLNPLMHFWGNAAGSHNNMQSWMDTNNIPDSRLIYDRLKHYQSVIPSNLTQFRTHSNIFYSHLNATDKAYYDTMRANGGWGQEEHDEVDARVQWIIDRFFPNGRPKITSYPHVANFDDNYNEWGHQENDDWDWRLHTGPSESTTAGSLGAPDNSQYLLLEGHDTSSGEKKSHMDCVYDMRGLSGAKLTFDYHMCGPYVDSLSVDVHDGTQWHADVWIKEGPQQPTPSDPWESATVSLSAFVGNEQVVVRFRGQKAFWNAGDISLDNVVVDEAVNYLTLPYSESFESGLGSWKQATGENVNGEMDWTRHSGPTDTGATGPSQASDGSWFIYFEGHDNGIQFKTASIDNFFDFTGNSNPQLKFDYHMFGPYIDFLAVDIHDGTAWTDEVWKKTGAQHGASEDAWSTATVDLSTQANLPNVTIRFRAKQQRWHAADMAVDNIFVENVDLATPYSLWAAVALAGATPGTDITESGNADGDRYTNVEEWILLLDPLVADHPVLTTMTTAGGFSVTYDRRNVENPQVRAAWSRDLQPGSWKYHGDGLTETLLQTNGDVETVSAIVPFDEEKKFIRLEVWTSAN
ncbi:MAG: M60 family peptidase N-terminal accessory domain-containing protein [Roseibacillus sp.]